MIVTINDILDEVSHHEGFEYLLSKKEEITITLEQLNLKPGQKYYSLGIGKNSLPILAALSGLDVVGIDVNPENILYQEGSALSFKEMLNINGGSLAVYHWDIDKNPKEPAYGEFDLVECVNFTRKYDPMELARHLVSMGKSDALYLASIFGGPQGRESPLVTGIIRTAVNINKSYEIIDEKLLASDRYPNSRSTLINVY